MSLHPCHSCGRHVRRSETRCPFCAVLVSFEGVPERGVPSVRLGRAATFAFGAAVATSALAGCGPTSSSPDANGGSFDAAYGGPPRDAAVVDLGGMDAAYGAPPHDANAPDANSPDANSAVVDTGLSAAYGAPPP